MKLLLSCLMMAVLTTIQPIKLTEKDAGQIIRVKPDQFIHVSLKTNLSTGYDWHLAKWCRSSVGKVQEIYLIKSGQTDKVGSPTSKVFIFQTKTAGQFDIEFLYKRSTFAEIKHITYTFRVINDELPR